MRTSTTPRRIVLGLAGIAAATATAGTMTLPAASAADSAGATAAPTTKITFTVASCEGCTLQLGKAVAHRASTWESPRKQVHDGTVSFTTKMSHTRGMSVMVLGPWELSSPHGTGAATELVFSYGRQGPGSPVSLAAAQSKKQATGCWQGTAASEITIPLTVRELRVPGNGGPADATIAFTSVTQYALTPFRGTDHGILGEQDIDPCVLG